MTIATEFEVQNALERLLWGRANVIAPNFTPFRWFECDLYVLLKSGTWQEYEIKRSVSDFKADAKKGQRMWDSVGRPASKHCLLEKRDINGPNQFYYVLPSEMLTKVEIPEWAGVYTFATFYSDFDNEKPVGVNVRKVKLAPTRHKRHADIPRIVERVRRSLSHRFWDVRRKLQHERRLNKQHDTGGA